MWQIPTSTELKKSKLQPEGPLEIEVQVEDLERFGRPDQFLAAKTKLSRMAIKRLFESGEITATVPLKLNKMPPAKTLITIDIPPPFPCEILPEEIPLDIVYEDEDMIFINKAAGMVVHPAPGNPTGTLLNALLFHCPHLTGGGKKRPGIVHRLDKGTSGVMVAAKSQKAYDGLIVQFSTHQIQRSYMAITQLANPMAVCGTIQGPFGRHPKNRFKMSCRVKRGKTAITHYRLVKTYPSFQLLELALHTGRTHQIRAHLSEELGAPILCDSLYGNPKQQLANVDAKARALLANYPHPLLHAKKLGLVHPLSGRPMEFEIPPPSPFRELISD